MLISRLFRRRHPVARRFAQLDAQGNCVSLWALEQAPDKGHWVQVSALNPLWLGHPLPSDAGAGTPFAPSDLPTASATH
ncbi:MAG TPA: hypothetical protein VLO13_01135 [Halomonas sp.]|nr:hypothetical protein [Halomonas sp.]